jgi:hypothetical protein
MTPANRGSFVAAYSKLITEVWADPAKERLLEENPRDLLAGYGLTVPDGVHVTVVRDVGDADPDLDEQVRLWESGVQSGEVVLVVPRLDLLSEQELAEDELDAVVAGLDSSCACCCPCCCTT